MDPKQQLGEDGQHDTLRMDRAELEELMRQSSDAPPPLPSDFDLSQEALDDG